MHVYTSKAKLLPGSSYSEVVKFARKECDAIAKRTPHRHVYVRSSYFNKSKIFISPLFWDHLMQKNIKERTKRLKFYNASIDLMRKTYCDPHTIIKSGDLLHRFFGRTKSGYDYCVQIKQDKRTGRLDFMSCYPEKKS